MKPCRGQSEPRGGQFGSPRARDTQILLAGSFYGCMDWSARRATIDLKCGRQKTTTFLHYYLTYEYDILTLCEHISWHHLPFYQISALIRLQIWLPGGHLEKNKVVITPELTLTNGWISSKFLSSVLYLVRLHDIKKTGFDLSI
jgi:hypothetical protein